MWRHVRSFETRRAELDKKIGINGVLRESQHDGLLLVAP
jgi:hypothetical protein